MKVGDLIGCRKEVYTVSEETSVHQVAQYLRAKEVRTVGVLGADGRLTGVVSQSDISDKVAAENKSSLRKGRSMSAWCSWSKTGSSI